MSQNRYLFVFGCLLLVWVGVPTALGLITSPTLSTFIGTKVAASTLCYQTTVRKGTSSPMTISNPTPPTAVRYIQTAADRFSKSGYRMILVNGVLPAAAASVPITLSIVGSKTVFPYNIAVEYWCT